MDINTIASINTRTELIAAVSKLDCIEAYEGWRDWGSNELLTTALHAFNPSDAEGLRASAALVQRFYSGSDELAFDGWGGYVDCTGNHADFIWHSIATDPVLPNGISYDDWCAKQGALFQEVFPGAQGPWLIEQRP